MGNDGLTLILFSFLLLPFLDKAFGLAAPSDGEGGASLGKGVPSLGEKASTDFSLPNPLLGDGIVT